MDEEEEGMKQGVREGSSSSYRLMVCSRIGLVDHRLNWVSVQSPANTSSTASPRLARESEKRVEATNDWEERWLSEIEKRNYPSTLCFSIRLLSFARA